MAETHDLSQDRSERILILAPLGRDASLAKQTLEAAGLVAERCTDVAAMSESVRVGVGALLLTQEALSPHSISELRDAVARQPPWSDTPVFVLVSGGAAAPPLAQLAPLLDSGLNVTLLERPMRATNLASVVRAALRAQRRQHELRDQLHALERAEGEQRRAVAQSELSRLRLRVLVELSAAFTEASRDLPTLVALITQRISKATGDGCALCLVRAEDEILLLAAVDHSESDQVASVRRAFTEAPPGTGAEQLVAAVEATMRRSMARNVLVVPIGSAPRALGALIFWRGEAEHPYTVDDRALRQELTDRAALAIDNALLFGEVQEQAEIHAGLNAALREAAIQRDRALADGQAERQRLNELFRQVPAGIVTTRGPEHTIDFANPFIARVVGGRYPEELLGKPLRQVLPDAPDHDVLELVERAYRHGEQQLLLETPIGFDRHGIALHEDGFFNIVLQPYRDADGRIGGVILHATEVTSLVRARERSRQLQGLTVRLGESIDTEALFAHLVDAVAELLNVTIAGLYLCEQPDFDFVSVAARGLEPGGVGSRLPRHGSMAGRAVDELRTEAADDVSTVQNVVLPRLVGGSPVGAVAVAPIFAREEALGAIEVYSPEARHWEAEDLELLAAFAAAAGVAISNTRLHERERQAIQARDDFLAAASHDLKNPLTAIRGATQMVQRGLARSGSVPSDRLAASMRTISNATTRMTNQIDELLDVARLRLGESLPLERSDTDLIALARQLADAHQATSESHPITVETDAAELVGAWDSRRVARAIDNLLSNAIKYSPEGGPITLSIGREGESAVLSLQDRGVGIPAADLPHIFERFRRAANVLGRIEGTGIGLAAAAQIIEQHGGSIDLQSRENVGTTVTIHLPLEVGT